MNEDSLPKLKSKTNDDVMSFALPKSTKKRIRTLKETKGVNTSEWIRNLVTKELDKIGA